MSGNASAPKPAPVPGENDTTLSAKGSCAAAAPAIASTSAATNTPGGRRAVAAGGGAGCPLRVARCASQVVVPNQRHRAARRDRAHNARRATRNGSPQPPAPAATARRPPVGDHVSRLLARCRRRCTQLEEHGVVLTPVSSLDLDLHLALAVRLGARAGDLHRHVITVAEETAPTRSAAARWSAPRRRRWRLRRSPAWRRSATSVRLLPSSHSAGRGRRR